jgi:hypothetical protein
MSENNVVPSLSEEDIRALKESTPIDAAFAENVNAVAEVSTKTSSKDKSWRFGYMFGEPASSKSIPLPPSSKGKIVEHLAALGRRDCMLDTFEENSGVPVPTIYTFFGQFVDHDITHERGTENVDLADPNLKPLSLAKVRKLENARSPNLELDSLYGSVSGIQAPPDPNQRGKLMIGEVSAPTGLPKGKSKFNDLPRRADGVALIGDMRNDENIILAQLHVAFLHAHNALIERGYTFEQAQKLLIQHYQWIVLEDYLPRVADPAIVKTIKNGGAKFFLPSREKFFIPLEFSAAAYRFGHSKVRASYSRYNEREEMGSVTLDQLLTFTGFSGNLRGGTQIPGAWVIDWKGFLNSDDKNFFSRPIDTRLARDMFNLSRERGNILLNWKRNLAIRNLLRSYLLNIPTGQTVAAAMQEKANYITPLGEVEMESVVTPAQKAVMKVAGFFEQTPLWFYILAEAAYYNKGYHLGPVGSTIVAETLIGILRYSDYSILSNPYWRPTLGLTPGKFDLEDLLILAGVY